jgi:hypothetical protein
MAGMHERKPKTHRQTEEIIKAFDRERAQAQDLSRRYQEETASSRARDRQVLIERRRQPR